MNINELDPKLTYRAVITPPVVIIDATPPKPLGFWLQILMILSIMVAPILLFVSVVGAALFGKKISFRKSVVATVFRNITVLGASCGAFATAVVTPDQLEGCSNPECPDCNPEDKP